MTTTATTEQPTTFLLGDVDNDGVVGIQDAQLTLIVYVDTMVGQESSLSDAQLKAADVNNDGKVSVDDAQWLLLYYTLNTVALRPTTWDELFSGVKL